MTNVKTIYFPNTSIDRDQSKFDVGSNCDEIRSITKSGEMASIGWFQIIKDNKVIAEIKESVCDIYGEDDVIRNTISF